MTPEEIAKQVETYQKRLANQRYGLDNAQDDAARANKRARYWLDECQITQRKILELERMKDDDART